MDMGNGEQYDTCGWTQKEITPAVPEFSLLSTNSLLFAPVGKRKIILSEHQRTVIEYSHFSPVI